MNERLVTHVVSEGVVQALEIIEIDQRQRQVAAVTTRTGQFALASLIKTAAVECAGLSRSEMRASAASSSSIGAATIETSRRRAWA
jgi:hypothetical protein